MISTVVRNYWFKQSCLFNFSFFLFFKNRIVYNWFTRFQFKFIYTILISFQEKPLFLKILKEKIEKNILLSWSLAITVLFGKITTVYNSRFSRDRETRLNIKTIGHLSVNQSVCFFFLKRGRVGILYYISTRKSYGDLVTFEDRQCRKEY